MRMQTVPTLKAVMNVNAMRDSRVMATPTVQVINKLINIYMYQKRKRHQANQAPNWPMEVASIVCGLIFLSPSLYKCHSIYV